MIDDAVFQRLAGFAGLSALVGSRIYPDVAPDNATAPYVVYQTQAPIDLGGDMDESGDLVTTRAQVDAWAAKRSQADKVAKQVRRALRDFSGTVAGVRIADIRADSGFKDFDDDPPPRLFRSSQDYLIQHYEED